MVIQNVTGTYNLIADPNWKLLQLYEVYIECDTTLAPVTINLFQINDLQFFWNAKIYVVDQFRNASSNPITINCNVLDTFGGTTTTSISTNGGSLCFAVTDNNTWLVTGGAGGGSSFISIDYTELYNAMVDGTLSAGSWYRITNYQSVNFLNGWELANQNPASSTNFNPRELYYGGTEVLIVQAVSNYDLARVGYSGTYSGDIIEYDGFTNKIGVDIDAYNGRVMPDSSVVSGFDLQWDAVKQEVYFNMPAGYPALLGHYFYLYADFTNNQTTGSVKKTTKTGVCANGGGTFLGIFYPTNIIGSGTGFEVLVFEGANAGDPYVVNFGNGGSGYQVGDTCIILGSALGGTDGVNDINFTIDTIYPVVDYSQDGAFDPLTNGISIPQYSYTSNNSYDNYPKQLSRVRVENGGYRIVMLDLTQTDANNYIADSLYVEYVEAIGDAFGWITRRNDTYRNINAPLDFRGRKYRRFEVDLSVVNPSLPTGYYGIGNQINVLGFTLTCTSNYIDYPVFSTSYNDVLNVFWDGVGGPDMYWYAGFNDNNVFTASVKNLKLSTYTYNNTFNFINTSVFSTICKSNICYQDIIDSKFGSDFNNNVINTFSYSSCEIQFSSNLLGVIFYCSFGGYSFQNKFYGMQSTQIGDSCQYNTLGTGFNNNKIGSNFQNNIFGINCEHNTILSTANYNTIGNSFQFNTIVEGFAFQSNLINNNFQYNQLQGYFIGNQINDYFTSNVITTAFNSNVIGAGFQNNNINAIVNAQDFIIGPATHVYAPYNCNIFTNSGNVLRLSYFDNLDVLTIVNPTS